MAPVHRAAPRGWAPLRPVRCRAENGRRGFPVLGPEFGVRGLRSELRAPTIYPWSYFNFKIHANASLSQLDICVGFNHDPGNVLGAKSFNPQTLGKMDLKEGRVVYHVLWDFALFIAHHSLWHLLSPGFTNKGQRHWGEK